MKQFTLKSLMLLLLLLIGGGSYAWGETKTITLDKIGTGVGGSSNTSVKTTSISLNNGSDKFVLNYLQGKNYRNAILLARGTGAFISNNTPVPGTIKSVEVFINADASKKTSYHCAFSTIECTKAYTTGSTAVNIQGGKSNVFSCGVKNANYFCVSLGNESNGQVLKLVITYEDSSTPQPGEVAVPTLSLAEGTYWGKQTLTIGVPEGAAGVQYTLDGTDPKESNTAELITKATNLELSATTTVRAIAVDNNDHYSKEVSRTYTFVLSIANTKETAYTTTQAIEIINKTSAEQLAAENVYVKGVVSKVDSYKNKSITYWLDDNTFQVYSGMGLDNKGFNSKEDIETGANVIICGKIKKFSNNTYEFDKGNYLVEYKAPVEKVLKSIAISGEATKTTYFEGETFDPTGLVVTATYDDESTEDVTSRVKWTFNPETLVLGTTSVEVMASIGSDAISDVYIVNGITVKEKMILVGNSIVVAEDTKNSKWVAMSTSNINGDKTDYFESVDLVKVGDKYITTGKLDDILFYVNTVDGKTSIQNPADNKYVQATGEKKVSYTEKEYLWSNNGEQLAAAQTAHGTLQYNVAAPRFTTYAKKVGQYATIVDKSNVYEGAVIALSGTDGTHYFTTFSSDKAVEFVDATVYTVGVNENKLSLNEVKGNQVPANTGVLVQSNKTDAMYVYIESAPAIEGNLLRASVTEQTTTGADDTKEYKYYMLSYNKDNENLGFYWGENDGAAFTSKAGRAYLAVEKTNEVAAVKGFSLSDMETGISQVCGSAANNGVIYDLQGRRVERAVRGLYIMNGRKVMVK